MTAIFDMASRLKTPERLPLESFLAQLPGDDVEPAREAAERMRSNEHFASQLRGVEKELAPFFITGGVSFIIGIVAILFFADPGGLVNRIDGAWPIVTASLAFLPILLVIYAIRIRKRSAADMENAELNQEHFLPHGAIYFPSDAPGAEQMVTLVEIKPQPNGWRQKYDRVRFGATR
jgi:hypothetical protein